MDLVDVIEGRGPSPSLVLSLVQRLPDTSLTVALEQGGREFFGWGRDRYMLADLFDAINANTRATGQFKGKPPKFPEYPRPKGEEQKKATSIESIYARFNRR